jgi:hypothetical protein
MLNTKLRPHHTDILESVGLLMEIEIVFAVMGAMIGATIGQLNGDWITNNFLRYYRDRFQKIIGAFDRSDPGDNSSN